MDRKSVLKVFLIQFEHKKLLIFQEILSSIFHTIGWSGLVLILKIDATDVFNLTIIRASLSLDNTHF
jgi:hypothetical protein